MGIFYTLSFPQKTHAKWPRVPEKYRKNSGLKMERGDGRLLGRSESGFGACKALFSPLLSDKQAGGKGDMNWEIWGTRKPRIFPILVSSLVQRLKNKDKWPDASISNWTLRNTWTTKGMNWSRVERSFTSNSSFFYRGPRFFQWVSSQIAAEKKKLREHGMARSCSSLLEASFNAMKLPPKKPILRLTKTSKV